MGYRGKVRGIGTLVPNYQPNQDTIVLIVAPIYYTKVNYYEYIRVKTNQAHLITPCPMVSRLTHTVFCLPSEWLHKAAEKLIPVIHANIRDLQSSLTAAG